MQCIWSKASHSFLRKATSSASPLATQKAFAASRGRTHFTPGIPGQFTLPPAILRRAISSSSRFELAPKVALRQRSPRCVPDETLDILPSTPPSSLTTAQISLAASRAVRISCRNGALTDAAYIINSLRGSTFIPNPRAPKIGGPFLPKLDFDPIDFCRPVSPALSAHGLLHHFIRAGETVKARQFARQLIRDGIRVRGATLHAVVDTQINTGTKLPRSLLSGERHTGPDILSLRPEMAADEGTRYALSLLLLARRHRQRCSDKTYQSVIHACLLQGEIIVASLLFVLLVKDWEVKQKMAAGLKAQIAEEQLLPNGPSPDLRNRWASLLADAKRSPPKRLMSSILMQCEENMLLEPNEESAQPLRHAALQALANIAGLLDRRLLPFTDVSSLIRVLSRCPKASEKVWVFEGNREKPSRVEAYGYFHRVLHEFAHSLSLRAPCFGGQEVQSRMPPLSRETYNSLLHYAFRHRQSLPLANQVLHHMEHERSPPLKPDITTYNIFMRSSTLMRRNDLSELALAQLRCAKENQQHGISVQPPKPLSLVHKPLLSHNQPLFSDSKSDPRIKDPLSADVYTLTSYIMHLTSTGQPHVVAKILFHVLPELSAVDHPSWGVATEEDRREMRKQNRDQRLARAVILGPRFFTAVLNALCKAGKTGLTERVWLLAKEAERASWMWSKQYGDVVKPWCLPVHAYTIMLQCYGAEARKGLKIRHLGRAEAGWVPKSRSKVRGWAYFVLANRRARKDLSRRTLALRASATLSRAMFRGAKDIYDTLVSIRQTDGHRMQVPRPDARFFNAALELFGRQPSMRARSYRTSPAHWRHKLGSASSQYTRFGKRPRGWNPFLARLVKEMAAAGYPIPAAFQRLFAGHWPYGFMHFKDKTTLNKQPFKFPRPRKMPFRPHALSTLRERGIPVRRREWTQTGCKWRWKRRRRKVERTGEKQSDEALSYKS
ncbi:hypothetical protein BV22DRAFT_1090176 [Leucogyrophana mollusca]|uniref:Uncharacterized protein n=1 Tax=Leucogyrophana mollusca TaxID=85980 RepID=A0ACB8BJ32_9AGAM|nr:hypothetical protein BV22DRAFT_1090176 [Leucogyrophana mollusca]